MDKALTKNLDHFDYKILKILQKEGRLSNQQLAERTGMSPAACWRRVKALEESGIINRYSALLDRNAVGLDFCVFLHVSLTRHQKEHVSNFEYEVNQRPEVLECYVTTGDTDFTLRVVTEDMKAYDAFLENFIFNLPGIANVKSNIALREIKFTTCLPISQPIQNEN